MFRDQLYLRQYESGKFAAGEKKKSAISQEKHENELDNSSVNDFSSKLFFFSSNISRRFDFRSINLIMFLTA